MSEYFDKIQQGWQCPSCKHVYSPTTPMCYYCPQKVKIKVNSIPLEDFERKTGEKAPEYKTQLDKALTIMNENKTVLERLANRYLQ